MQHESGTDDQIKQAVQVLHTGGIISYPTESVYGFGCDPDNEQSIRRLLAIKQREADKGLILIASDISQLMPYLKEVDRETAQHALSTWPGPYTWLWPAKETVSPLLRGAHETLAVRISAHPVVHALCKSFGKPLISTSANRAGEAAANTAVEVETIFSGQLDFVVSGEVGDAGTATEIRDLITGKVIRPAG